MSVHSGAPPVRELVLGSAPGPVLHLVDRGAAVRALHVTDGAGVRRNVVLGHRDVQAYGEHQHYLGSSIGRYANRIAMGRFELDGARHQLAANDRGNHLHGGPGGFHCRTWSVTAADEVSALLRLDSPDGDEGYPGTLAAEVRYEVDGDVVRIAFRARTDAATLVNLTSHAYFCLAGEGRGTVRDHVVQVQAQHYLPVDGSGIPTGALEPLAGSPFDMRLPVVLDDVLSAEHPQLRLAGGVDHNLVLDGHGLRPVAELRSEATGIGLQLWTDQPGLQVYTGNDFDGSVVGTSGRTYPQHAGVALEPQVFPDSPNRPEWPSAVLRPGEEYASVIEWRWSSGRMRS